MKSNIKWQLPLVLGVMGFIFSTRSYILWLDKQSPFSNLIIYYIIMLITLWILQRAGLIISGVEFTSMNHLIGSILIIFAYFITIDWESCYVNTVTRGSCKNMSNIYLGAEDGATYYMWSKYVTQDVSTLRLLTYVVTPMVLAFIGTLLITEHVYISPI